MKKWILAISLLLSVKTFSQNAYYDMLQLLRWYHQPDSAVDKRANAQAMLVKLLKYSDSSSAKFRRAGDEYGILNRIYGKADSLYSFSKRYEIPRPVVLYTAARTNFAALRRDTYRGANAGDSTNAVAIRRLADTVLQIYRIDSALNEQVHQAKRPYDNLPRPIAGGNFLIPLQTAFKKLTDSLVRHNVGGIDTVSRQGDTVNTAFILTRLANLIQRPNNEGVSVAFLSLDTLLQNWLSHVSSVVQSRLSHSEERLYQETMRLPPLVFRRMFAAQMNLQPEEGMHRADNEQDYLYAKASVEEAKFSAAAGSSQSLSDFNFPSETQIIDAIGIYLARRARQEAALFFIENLGKALKNDDLARELFPKTSTLMLTQEAYEAPRFGTKWREAIATDYITLPENISKSKFIDRMVPESMAKNYFHDAVVFAGYVGKKYSFVDVLRTVFADTTKLAGEWTKVGASVLHIVNQELYDTSKQRYWISPQAFFDLKEEQLLCLYNLVRIKYEDKVPQVVKKHLTGMNAAGRDLGAAARFYTELLTILQQFYAAQAAPVKSADGTMVIHDGFWDTQRNLVDLLLNATFIPLHPKERKALEGCKKAFFVYDYLSNKNYIAATENVLDIIGLLTNHSPRTLINLSIDELKKIEMYAPSLRPFIDNCNNEFETIRTILLFNEFSLETKDTAVTRGSMETLLDGTAAEKSVLDALFREQVSYTPTAFRAALGKLKGKLTDSLQHHFETLKETYSKLTGSIKNEIADLQSGKVTYKSTHALLNNLQHAGYALQLQNKNYFKWLTDFSELLTEIAMTKNSESLSNLIESYALPPGSYRQKRNAVFSIDLNAYVGGYFGRERIEGKEGYGNVYGLTAPIGVSFSLGTTKKAEREEEGVFINKRGNLKKRTQHSWTLDLTVVDIGAVVSYRLGNGPEKGLPQEVKWSQVLSFGANLRYGLKGTPLCFGIGYQHSPELRTVNQVQKSASRFHATIAFDLPLVNFARWR